MNSIEQLKIALDTKGISYKLNEPLAKYTSFKIGGPCEIMVLPKSEEEVVEATALCQDIPMIFLGNGSNVLVSDEGIQGVVILLNNNFADIRLIDSCTIEATAGVSLVKLCNFAYEHGLSGLEFAFGIPATVGGAIYMNAGAYEGEMSQVLVKAKHITPNGKVGIFEQDALNLSYRHSVYSDSGYCILSGVFRLKPAKKEEIRAKMDDLMNRRKTKQPLEYPSAGSTFKRPPNTFAAKLIEDCGLKGLTVGGAQVSEKHSGFVVNKGNATCCDVKMLIEQVKEKVKEQTNIELECEVKMIGKCL